MSAKYDIFISYRREGGLDHARTIFRELQQRGYRCFFDFSELKTGKFSDSIQSALQNCAYFVLVVTDGFLDRSCSDENDWVRKEIELAISLGKPIIPICPSGNKRDFPAGLPSSLQELRTIQISRLSRDDLFDESVEKIVKERLSGLKAIVVRRRLPLICIVALAAGLVLAVIAAVFAYNMAQRRAERIEDQKNAVLMETERKAREARAKAEIAEAKAREEKARREAEAKVAEAARARIEAEAKAAETARINAERKAKEEEKARLEAEKLRAEEEKRRQEALREQARLEAEKIRIERERQAAKAAEEENKRKAREAARKRMQAFDSL